MIRNILRTIKFAYQRVVRGYDDSITWGFSYHFIMIIPALKQFCEKELEYEYHMSLNPHRKRIYTRTLKLIATYNSSEWYSKTNDRDEAVSKLAEYFGKNINIYWD